MRCSTSEWWRATGPWCVVLVLALGSLRAAAPAGGQSEALEIDYIAAAIRQQRQRVQVGSAVIERELQESAAVHEFRNPGAGTGEVPPEPERSTVRWYLDGDRLAVIHDDPTPRRVNDELTASYVLHLAANGQQVRQLIRTTARQTADQHAEPRLSHQGRIESVATAMPHGVIPGAGWMEPRWLTFHARTWSPELPLDELLLDPKVEVEVVGTETIADRPAVHVQVAGDVGVTVDYWLDLDRDYICLRAERRRTRGNGTVMSYHDETTQVERRGDVWMVTGLVRRLRTALEGDEGLLYRDREGVEVIGATTLLPPTVITIRVRDLQLETAPPPEVFVVEFPDFTLVMQEGVRGERRVQYVTREEFQELWERRRERGPER